MSVNGSEKWFGDERVILLCGVSGSGKTWLGRRLAAYGFTRLSADELLWRKWGDGFPDLPPKVKGKAFAEVQGMLGKELESLLEDGSKVVVDSTLCRRAKRDELRAVCARHGVRPLLVFLDVPFETLRARLAERKGEGCDDQIVPPEDLGRFWSGFERPDPEEDPRIFLLANAGDNL